MAKKIKTAEERLKEALVPREEWPYELPDKWCWVRLGSIVSESKEKTDDFSNTQLKYVGLENMTKDYGITSYASSSGVKSTKNIFHSGDVLYGKLRPYLNKHDIADFDGICSTDIIVMQPKSGLSNEYLNYYLDLNFFIAYASNHTKGINLPRLSPQILMQAPFPYCAIEEQMKIVSTIGEFYLKLDQAREKVEAVLDTFEKRKAAILHQAFTGKLSEKWRVEHGLSLESWTDIGLESCGKWFGGGTPSKAHPEYWDDGNIRWITSKDMKEDIIEDSQMHITFKGVENSSANLIQSSAILIVTRSGILKHTFPVAIVHGEFTVNQDLKAIIPLKDIDVKFLFYVLKSQGQRILQQCMKSGTTVESINTLSLKKFIVPVATLAEQREIVRLLDDLLDQNAKAEGIIKKYLFEVDLLKKSILARAFRGELGTGSTDDPPALEELKSYFEKAEAEERNKSESV